MHGGQKIQKNLQALILVYHHGL